MTKQSREKNGKAEIARAILETYQPETVGVCQVICVCDFMPIPYIS